MRKRIVQLISNSASAVVILAILVGMLPAANVSAENSTKKDPIVVVSLGDSYSSGEGVEPFYGQEKKTEDKIKDENWAAHRSRKAWPALLKIGNKTTGDYNVEETNSSEMKWYFKAASGAKTKDFKGKQEKEINIKKGAFKYSNNIPLDPQLDVFKKIEANTTDYVTFTIGGNDVDFANIILRCALGSTYLRCKWLDNKINRLWKDFDKEEYDKNGNLVKNTAMKIEEAYRDVRKAAGEQAVILVVGYPTLFDRNGKGEAISQYEAKKVNSNVSEFNYRLKKIVTKCSDPNIKFVDVETVFKGHEAYSEEPWINPIWLIHKSEDINVLKPASSYSMHPSEKGCEKYAECVNKAIAEIEEEKEKTQTKPADDSNKEETEDNFNHHDSPTGYIEIRNAQELSAIRNDLTGKYILMNDIDLSSVDNWLPIGDISRQFKGVFDGNGYKITNMNIDDTVYRDGVNRISLCTGLFGATDNATIKNIANVTGTIKCGFTSAEYIYAGGLVGLTIQSAISNCNTDVDIIHDSGTPSPPREDHNGKIVAGGLVGSDYDAHTHGRWGSNRGEKRTTISNCSARGSIKETSFYTLPYLGGICGSGFEINISNCYSKCNLSIETGTIWIHMGGILGCSMNTDKETIIQNCCSNSVMKYNAGNKQGQKYHVDKEDSDFYTVHVGGIIGTSGAIYADLNSPFISISNCAFLSTSATKGTGWEEDVSAEGNKNLAHIDATACSQSEINNKAKKMGFTV